MPIFTTSAGDALFYRDDCFSPPWATVPVTLMLHAEAENGLAWYGWMQRLSGRSRVIRMDLRGAGLSVGMRPGQAWSLDRLAADAIALLDGLGIEVAHVIAARFAGPVALRLAAAHPARVTSLTLCSVTPDPAGSYGDIAASWAAQIDAKGLDAWAVNAAQERLAGEEDEKMLQGWADLLAGTDRATLVSLFRNLAAFDASSDLARILCPTLVATTDASTAQPLDATTGWQRRITQGELLVLNGPGDHVAATHARELAGAVLDFHRRIEREAAQANRKRPKPEQAAVSPEERERRRLEREERRARPA
jgi:3-oxoadipate enol-lactonase